MHIVADQIQAAVSIPMLHLIDVTATAIRAAELHHGGLLGTKFTMDAAFYRERLATHGLTLLVPGPRGP